MDVCEDKDQARSNEFVTFLIFFRDCRNMNDALIISEKYFDLKKRDLEAFIEELRKQSSVTPVQVQDLLARLKRLREVASEIESRAHQEVSTPEHKMATVRFYFLVQTVLGDDEGTMFDEDIVSAGGEIMRESLGYLQNILKNINIEMTKPVEKRARWAEDLRKLPTRKPPTIPISQ